MTTIYGIKNCDTMKKAFAWLDEHGVAYTFHDYKKAGIDSGKLHAWSKAIGWKSLVNTRGTTWRKLSPEQQAIETQSAAVQLMQEFPSVIRRPVIETDSGQLLVGLDTALYTSFLTATGTPE
ncbi:ArsC family reductase [Zoogloea sp. LCSB751]|uniref:ArsC family reductase n=1 Tax=Zoogloea sp. LCSB751 TaxID=1965277 RepID=UPI0009A542CF|nr:ArsC family reductase [Zoogloea sp. LCSB751]